MSKKEKSPFEKGAVVSLGKYGCCSTVRYVNEKDIVIHDRFGGSITLSYEEWEALEQLVLENKKQK